MLQLKIGRNPDNDIMLPYPQVSGKHAKITQVSENSFLLEDLGSVNGSFVNGLQVNRMVMSATDKLKIAHFSLDFIKYFPTANKVQKEILPKKDNDYSAEFTFLKDIYEQYEAQRKTLKNRDQFKKTTVRAGLALIPWVGNAIAIMVCDKLGNEEKMQALDTEFKISYVCPKCKNFLGYFPFVAIAAKKSCMYCKAVWVK